MACQCFEVFQPDDPDSRIFDHHAVSQGLKESTAKAQPFDDIDAGIGIAIIERRINDNPCCLEQAGQCTQTFWQGLQSSQVQAGFGPQHHQAQVPTTGQQLQCACFYSAPVGRCCSFKLTFRFAAGCLLQLKKRIVVFKIGAAITLHKRNRPQRCEQCFCFSEGCWE